MSTVLVLEDDPTSLEIFRRFLVKNGYFVLTATTGKEALHLAADSSREIDVLMADVVLEGSNGIEAPMA